MDEVTEAVIAWALSAPVLTVRLAEISRDEILYGVKELPCTVVDLLDPQRSPLWADFLTATGAHPADADAVWEKLSQGRTQGWHWMTDVCWSTVRQTLLARRQRLCDVWNARG